MNTGQTILTIGALILLGYTVLFTNRSSLQYGAVIDQTEIDIYSVSLAESIIEEASGKAFDHYSATDTAGNGSVITALSQLTISSKLGKESDDTLIYTQPSHYYFDDIDDYNEWSKRPFVQYVQGVDSFHLWASVFYVDSTNPNVAVTGPTWNKKIVVKVWPTITAWGDKTPKPDTVQMSYIYSYWWF